MRVVPDASEFSDTEAVGAGDAGAGAWVSYLTYRSLGTAMQKLPELVAAAAASVVAMVLSNFSGKAGAMYGRHLRRVLGPELSDAEAWWASLDPLLSRALAGAGVDFADVTATLEREGVASFSTSIHDAFKTLEKRRAEVT